MTGFEDRGRGGPKGGEGPKGNGPEGGDISELTAETARKSMDIVLVRPEEVLERLGEVLGKKISRTNEDFTQLVETGGPGVVVSLAPKMVIPVGKIADGTEPIDPESGKPVLDWQGNPREGTGVVWKNPVDNKPQFVAGDGNGVIIINEATEEMATKVITLARRHGWKDESGGFESRSQVEAFMASIKEVGLVDTYDSNVDYVANNLSRPTGTDGLTLGIGGFLLKAGKPAFAVFIPPSEKGTLVFGHDSNSAQHDTTGRGLVIVLDPSVAEVRVVQVNVFERTYQNADGNPVHPDTDLPRIETT